MRLLYFTILLLFSSSSFAEDYYWLSNSVSGQFPSATAACNAGMSGYDFTGLVSIGTNAFSCMGTDEANYIFTPLAVHSVARHGDSCPSGQIYLSASGECIDPPTCEELTGLSAGFNRIITSCESSSGAFIRTKTGGIGDGCEVAAVGNAFIDPDTGNGVQVRSNFQFTGSESAPSTSSLCDLNAAPCPSDYTKDTNGVCRPTPGGGAEEAGEGQCEISSGSCITFDPGVTLPTTGTEGGTGQESEPGEGGTGTEPSSEGGGGSGGVVIGGGEGAASSGQSTEDLDGDGDTGTCDPDDPNCIQTNNGTVEGGLICDVPPVCDGDDVLCAQLMQQYLQRCPNENFEQPTLGSTAEKLAEVTAEFNTEWNRVKSEAESKFSTSLSSGGSIPTRVTSVFGVNIDFSISRFLPYLQIIANLIIAAAWIMAAGIVLSGRG